MKVVTHTHTHLKLQHYPWGIWLFGALIVSIVPVNSLGQGLPTSGLGFAFLVFVVSVIIAGVIIQLQGQVSTCDFYKSLNVVTLKHRGLLGVKVTERALQNISSIQVIEEIRYTKGRRYERYNICLSMYSGEAFDLTTDRLANRSLACQTAEVVSKFLNVPHSFIPGVDNKPSFRIF